MTKEEMIKGLTYLGTIYGKEFTSRECEIYYDFLKEYRYDVFVQAVKNIVKQSKFIPKISDLVEECVKCQSNIKFEILDYMNKLNYFKDPLEFDKAMNFLVKNLIPSWFKEDMEHYYKLMNAEKLETSSRIMING